MKIEFKLEHVELEFSNDIITKSIANASLTNRQLNTAKRIQKAIKMALDGTIENEVLEILSKFSGVAIGDIKNSHTLKFGLGIGDTRKLDLAVPFTRLVSKYKAGTKLTRSECGDLKKVSDCINHIKSKVG